MKEMRCSRCGATKNVRQCPHGMHHQFIPVVHPARQQIEEYALRAFPREACGFVLETGAVVDCTNTDDAPFYRYTIDPAEAQHWWNTGRVRGVWHSHPNDPAVPSEGDMQQWQGDTLLWPFDCLIYSVPDEDLGTYRADGSGRLALLRMESPE